MMFVDDLDSEIGEQNLQQPELFNHLPNSNPLAVDIGGYPDLNPAGGDSQMTDENAINPELSKKKSFDPDKIASEELIEQQRRIYEQMQNNSRVQICAFCDAPIGDAQE